jgi:hypothetical protein
MTARRCGVVATIWLFLFAVWPSPAARSMPRQTTPVPKAMRCLNEQQMIFNAESQFFVAHDRYADMADLSFAGAQRPTQLTVALWPGDRVYVVTPIKGKGCEFPSDASQRFVAKAAMFCGGVQQAVFGLQSSVLRGHDLPPDIPPARSAEFYRRGAALIPPLKQHLARLSPPAVYTTQWHAALQAFDGISATLDDLARTQPTDFATDRAVYERHREDYQRFHDAWAPIVDGLGIDLQACQYLGFAPSSGR